MSMAFLLVVTAPIAEVYLHRHKIMEKVHSDGFDAYHSNT
jgi:ribonucleotide reductase beta subunit family protein with ferritin-like domain